MNEATEENVRCRAIESNPPSVLSWMLDEAVIDSFNQTNTLDETSNLWISESVLQYTFEKEDRNKVLNCIATHPAFKDGINADSTSGLNVLCK